MLTLLEVKTIRINYYLTNPVVVAKTVAITVYGINER